MSGGIAAAGLAMAAIGTAVSVAGQMQQASAAKASANYQAKVAEGNQQIANQNASFAAASGEAQAAIKQQETRAKVGAIEAAQGSSGVDINSPTSTAVRTSQSELGMLDTQTIKSNAARQAYGYQTQSTNFGNQASADLAQGANASSAGKIGAASSLLSGAGNAGLNYAKVVNDSSGLSADGNFSGAYTDASGINWNAYGS